MEKSERVFKDFLSFCRDITGNDTIVLQVIQNRYNHTNPHYLFSDKFCDLVKSCTEKMQQDPTNKFVYIKDFATELKTYKAKPMKHLIRESTNDDAEGRRSPKRSKLDPGEHTGSPSKKSNLCRLIPLNTPTKVNDKSVDDCAEMPSTSATTCDVLDIDESSDKPLEQAMGSPYPLKKAKVVLETIVLSPAHLKSIAAMKKDLLEEKSMVSPGKKIDKEKLETVMKLRDKSIRGSDAQISRLELLLKKISDRIKKLEERELSLEDMEKEDTSYVLCDRYKAKFVKVWNKLCNINGRPNTTGRDTEKSFKYEETKYPEINKAVSQFVNKYQLFPDFQDVHEIIVKCNTRYNLQIRKRTIESLAQETFIMVGDMLQKRRMKDYASNFGCHLMDNIKVNDDPALVDAELRRKLEANKKTSQQNLEKVMSKFAHLQAEHGDSTDDDDDTGDDDSKKEHGVSSDYDMNSQEEDGFLSQTEQKSLSGTELETDLQEKLVESDHSMETLEDQQVLPATDVEKSCEVPSSSGEVQGFLSCEESGSGKDEKKGSSCGEISVSSIEDVEGSSGCEVPGSSNGEVKGSLSSEVKRSSSGEVPGCSSDEVQGSVHDEVSGSSSCEVKASLNAVETPGRLDAEALPGTTSESKKEGDVVCRTVDSLENVVDVSDNLSEHSELNLMTNSRMNVIGTVVLRDDVEKNLSEVSDPEVSIELTDESLPSCENRSEDSDVEPIKTCAPKSISCVPETIDLDASIELMDESFHSRGNADNSEIQVEEQLDQNTSAALDANLELQIENLLNCKNSSFEDRLNTFVNNILESDGHKASDKIDSRSVGIESNNLGIIKSTDDFKEKSDSTVKHLTTGKSLRKREATKFQRVISQDVITCDDSLDNIIDLKSPEDLEIGQQKSINKSADKTDFENVLKVDCDVQSPGVIIEMNRSHEIGPLKNGKRSGDKTDFENILKVGSGRRSPDIIEIDKTVSDHLENCSNDVGKNLNDGRTLENISDADDCHLSPDVVEIDKSCSVLVDTVEDVILVDIPKNKSEHAVNDVVQGCSKKCEDSSEVTVVCSPSSSMSLDNDLPLLPTASKETAIVEEEPLSTIIQTSDNCSTETGDLKEKTDEVMKDGNVQTSSLKVDVDTDDRSNQSSSTGISVISDAREEELSSDSDSVVLDAELDSKVSKALGVKLDETLTNSIVCLDQDDGSPKKPVSCAKPTSSTDSEVNCAADEKVAFTVKSSNTVSPASVSVPPASKSVKRSASPDDDSAVICLDDVSMDTDSNSVDDENDCIVLSPDKGAPTRFRGNGILSQLMTKPLKPVAKRPKLPQSVPPHYNMSQFHRQLDQQFQTPRGFDHRTLQSSNNRSAGRVVGEVVNCWSLPPPQPTRHSMPVPRRSRKLFPAAIGSRMLQPASSTLPMLQSEDIFKISSDIVSKIFQNQSGKPPSDSDVIVCDDDSHSSSSISMLPQGFDDHLNLVQPFKLSPMVAHKRTAHRRPRGAGSFHSTPKVPARPPVQEDSVIMLE